VLSLPSRWQVSVSQEQNHLWFLSSMWLDGEWETREKWALGQVLANTQQT
jgi:hypothetical protein